MQNVSTQIWNIISPALSLTAKACSVVVSILLLALSSKSVENWNTEKYSMNLNTNYVDTRRIYLKEYKNLLISTL